MVRLHYPLLLLHATPLPLVAVAQAIMPAALACMVHQQLPRRPARCSALPAEATGCHHQLGSVQNGQQHHWLGRGDAGVRLELHPLPAGSYLCRDIFMCLWGHEKVHTQGGWHVGT